MDSFDLKLLGERIKAARTVRNLTLDALAEQINIHKSTISRYEQGKIERPKLPVVHAIASALLVNPSWLIGASEDMHVSLTATPTADNVLPFPSMNRLPLLGSIACGSPVLAQEDFEGEVDLPEHIHADFALRCKGDSMINARIFDGDIVYIRHQDMVDNGEIAAVLIDNEATLKRVQLYEDHISLEPENPKYRPLVFWGDEMNSIRILGKAVAFTSTVR